jgi:hypothetical protein
MEEDLSLPASTLALLEEFRKKEKEEKERFEELLREHDAWKLRMEQETMTSIFKEDWQLSQFWYHCNAQLGILGILQILSPMKPYKKLGLVPELGVSQHLPPSSHLPDFLQKETCFALNLIQDSKFSAINSFAMIITFQ